MGQKVKPPKVQTGRPAFVSFNWDQCREHYRRFYTDAKKRRGLRQADVAAAGGLSGQNAISSLLAQTSGRGPSVENFLRALAGLGLTPAMFFTSLEHRELASTLSVEERFDQIETQIAELQRACPGLAERRSGNGA